MFDPEFDGMPSGSSRALPKRRRNSVRRKLHVGAALIAAVFGAVVLSKPHASGSAHAGSSAKTARVALHHAPLDAVAFAARFEGEQVAVHHVSRKTRVASAEGKKGGRVAHDAAFAELPQTMEAPGWRPDGALAAAPDPVTEQDAAFAATPAEGAPLPQFRPAAVKTKPAPVVAEAEPETTKVEQVAALKPDKPEQVVAAKPEKPKPDTLAKADKPETERKRSLGDVVLASLGGDGKSRNKAADATISAKAPEAAKAKTVREGKLKSERSTPLLGFAANEAPSAGGIANSMENFFNRPASVAGKRVAVYDISAATVTMPDGRVLEAHSGLGAMKDNPRYIKQKMNGPTPPDVYKLSMREKRFHGVAAIRMTPADGRTKHGRTGFLAHTALVRGTNGSHGCVAFKDYNTFLKAFKNGKITHMVVVN